MTRPSLNTITVLSILATLFGASFTSAQGKGGTLRRHQPELTSQPQQTGQVPPPGSTSYTFTFFGFPNAPYTGGYSINLGVTTSEMEITGAYGSVQPQEGYGSGMLMKVTEKKGTTTESFSTVSLPGFSLQQTDGVNDSGEIVGQYVDAANHVQGYLLSGGTFTKIQVPFTGAIQTLPTAINNSGLIVGVWEGSDDGLEYGFQLSGATYTSFNFPGGEDTEAVGVNNAGDIVGYFNDSAGVYHGFLLSGSTYTQIDVPGAIGTFAYGINDAGSIVGAYCLTTACLASDTDGEHGFLLSGGVFTTIDVPNAIATYPSGINDRAVIVGQYSDLTGETLGFIATP